jgi:hypothetical protein
VVGQGAGRCPLLGTKDGIRAGGSSSIAIMVLYACRRPPEQLRSAEPTRSDPPMNVGPPRAQITQSGLRPHRYEGGPDRHPSDGARRGRSQFAQLIECEDAGAVRIRRELEVDRVSTNQARRLDHDFHGPAEDGGDSGWALLGAAVGTQTPGAKGSGSDGCLRLVFPSQDDPGATFDVDPGRHLHLEQAIRAVPGACGRV